MTDVQLLGFFVQESDEASFRALVVRHGPTVLRVCRRVLHDQHEVEDAFQATFLVLVRKAPTIERPEALGNWLYGVAYRIAMKARRGTVRRRNHERKKAEMDPVTLATDQPWDDLGRVVREELERLPEPYRAPLELCYLKGQSHEEAASELGWPLGTLKVRLVRGRKKLRERLDRRGIAMALGLLLLLLRPRRAMALPEPLVNSTVEAMRLEAVGGPAATASDPRFRRSSRMARGIVESRFGSRLLWPLLLLLLSLATTGAVPLYGQVQAADIEELAALPTSLTDVLHVKCR